jgi:hypothetical protein
MSKILEKIKNQSSGSKEMITIFLAVILTATISGLYLGYLNTKNESSKDQASSLSGVDALGYFKDNIVTMFKDSFPSDKTDSINSGISSISSVISSSTQTLQELSNQENSNENTPLETAPLVESPESDIDN